MKNMREESEFGKGFVYCLGLFLAHAERMASYEESYKRMSEPEMAYEMWFNGAGDHMFEFQPDAAPKGLKKRCKRFKDRVLKLRWSMGEYRAIKEDYIWAVQEAKDILRAVDKANGVDVIKGSWE